MTVDTKAIRESAWGDKGPARELCDEVDRLRAKLAANERCDAAYDAAMAVDAGLTKAQAEIAKLRAELDAARADAIREHERASEQAQRRQVVTDDNAALRAAITQALVQLNAGSVDAGWDAVATLRAAVGIEEGP